MTQEQNPHINLETVSTRWSAVNHPGQFMLRYAPAVRSYFGALLKDPDAAADAFQKFCLRMVEKGFARASPDRGRFRDYLKKAVRNFAFNYRRDQHLPQAGIDLDQVPAADDGSPAGESQWLAEWQRTLLDRAWRALEVQQAGELYYTVLRLSADFPDENSKQRAQRISQRTSKPLSAEAFRQQLSRARRLFAALLRYEVAQTLEDATPQVVEEELIETGLMSYLRDLLRP